MCHAGEAYFFFVCLVEYGTQVHRANIRTHTLWCMDEEDKIACFKVKEDYSSPRNKVMLPLFIMVRIPGCVKSLQKILKSFNNFSKAFKS